eukprot:12422004-Karenia_brevis.AAC.1
MWPPVNAMRELATKLRERERKGEAGLYMYVDLKKFVPNFYYEFTPVLVDDNNRTTSKSKSDRRLDFAWWQPAFDRYALGAAILDQ